METPPTLEQLVLALDAGDLASARRVAQGLQSSGASLNQLAAEVLHELKQPLLGVKAYAQLLGEEGAGKGSLGLLLAQVERMEQIIADFTRLASNRPAPQERVSLTAAVHAAIQQFVAQPESSRLSLEHEVPEGVFVLGNARLLEQLVLNLLVNSRDAMGGLGRVKVVLVREGPAPVLYVADWGPGIAPEVRERLFEPYVTTKTRGSGLGLAVCRRIVHEHRGQLGLVPGTALVDRPPAATVFRVLFPALPEARPPQRKRLLVVDDEAIIRMVFHDLMSKECEVLEAGTAEEALEILRRERVDLIVTDKNMPGLSGLELAQEARRLDSNSRVILMTGYPSLVTAQQAIELGVLDYLLKPFEEIREVRDKLRRVLATPAAAPPAPAAPGATAGPAPRRVDVYEDNPGSARAISEALALLGLEANVLASAEAPPSQAPLGVVVSWDFSPAHGREAVELGKRFSQGRPYVVLAEHLTMETALESLRGGAAACLPKLLTDVRALSRELARALKVSDASGAR